MPPPRVVATLPTGATLHDLTRHLELGGWLTQSLPVVLGIPSTALKGGRPHLVQLGGIRRFAEEWDLSVAVDLSGQFDPTWEAEAAIARLGERLCLLRISASAPSRAAVGRDRVACRALHAAMDGDHVLEVAVAPVEISSISHYADGLRRTARAARWTTSPSGPPFMREPCARESVATREAHLREGSDSSTRPKRATRLARLGPCWLAAGRYRLVY